MANWVICPNCLAATEGKVGDPCGDCGGLMCATPLFPETVQKLEEGIIEVVIQETKDKALADSPENAVYAARTMMMEAFADKPTRTKLHASFYVKGKLVRKDVQITELSLLTDSGNLHCKGKPESIASGSRGNKDILIRSVDTNGVSANTSEEEVVGKATKALHELLMAGFSIKSRADGSVHTIKGADGKTTVAEVCVGKKQTRLNFRKDPGSKAPKGIELSGKSQSWKGGGVVVNEGNLAAARALLTFVTKSATPAAATTGTRPAAQAAARTRVSGGRSSGRKTESVPSPAPEPELENVA